jgi:hypothetical protein
MPFKIKKINIIFTRILYQCSFKNIILLFEKLFREDVDAAKCAAFKFEQN